MIKKLSYMLIFLLTVLTLKQVYSLEVPYLSGRINDLAGILSEESKKGMEQEVKDFETKTSNQIAVLTIPSLEGESLEDFSLKVVETWKLGQKGKDNGVLLLISKNDRKLRIEVGYGLEGALTDALSFQIINNEITPNFRSGNYDQGISAGLKAIMASIQGEYKPAESSKFSFKGIDNFGPLGGRLGLAAFILPILLIFTGVGILGKIWFMYIFMIPFWAMFTIPIFGFPANLFILGAYMVIFPILTIFFHNTQSGKEFFKRHSSSFLGGMASRSGGFHSSGFGGFSGGGSSFSGGGGSFGGGGSSGSW